MSEKGVTERILGAIERDRKHIVNLCSRTVRIPSENPPGQTSELAHFLKEYLENCGISARIYAPKKGIPNVVARVGSGKTPNLVLNAHMDVYPAKTGSGKWRSSPFSGKVKRGRILGRGVADMKSGLTALVYTLIMIGRVEGMLKGRLTLTLVSDEENMGKWGAQWLIDNLDEVRGDACLSAEATARRAIVIGEKGILWLRLRTTGKSVQGSYTTLGENAIVKMAKAISIVTGLNEKQVQIPNQFRKIITQQKTYYDREWAPGTGRLLDRITVNPARINGGRFIGLVPDLCEVELNTRAPIGTSTDHVKSTIKSKLENAGLGHVEIEVIGQNQPWYTEPTEQIVKCMTKCLRAIINKEPILAIAIGGSDQWRWRRRGVPCARYGPTAHGMGSTDEYVFARELINATKVHSATAVNYLI